MTVSEAGANAAKPTAAPTAAAGGDAAPGVERHEVTAVQAKATRQQYATRQNIHPKRAEGFFRRIKWIMLATTLGIYYLMPWVRWDRGANLPDQAVLIDFANQRLLFGPLEIWAQEFYFVTGLLVIGALALFLVTSLAGRVWCGYACPQTVWTDLMVAVERFWQGDRNQRIRLEKTTWTFEWMWKKTATHLSWLLIALATGGAFVFYFRDAPTLFVELLNGTAPSIAYLFLGVFTFTTYLLGGIAREQVCIYMCPWPRIQGAMLDDQSLLITYRGFRGEPRGPHKKGQSWDNRGDCVDCKACVAVCPMGIDIRDGAQLECIQCALCIDACDDIMGKLGRPKSLIAYDSFRNLEAEAHHERVPFKFIRPRTILYSTLIAIVSALMLWAYSQRTVLEFNVLPDRNPLFVTLSDGGVRNGFTVRLLNKRHDVRRLHLSVDGLPEAQVGIAGLDGKDPAIEVTPDNLRSVRVFVTVPEAALRKLASDATPFRFVLKDAGDKTTVTRPGSFRSPAP